MHPLDHLVYATPDLDATIAELEERTGVRATPGGSHPGRGTRNALFGLGPGAYLEVIGPDPAQSTPPSAAWFGVGGLSKPRLVTWAARATNLPQFTADASARGITLGPVRDGSRRRPDGILLSWQLTDPGTVIADGLVPFFIDWGGSPHPSAALDPPLALVGFGARHPDPGAVRPILEALGVELAVSPGDRPLLRAILRGVRGEVDLS